ncbi:hypothetical protein [Staphylococcus epidermidis]|uniref:hypothetical protein n=1 Tax=Staphylococcus epidermidis TaxID=1282 RepID=UPI00164325DD|nr:hypothetical protein [Staphylococcus epidermidis]
MVFGDGLRNGLIGIIRMIVRMLGGILRGRLRIENMFGVGGLGDEFVGCISRNDF